MNVGIIGGGILGIHLGYFLSRQGAAVEIFEASPTIGGLAGPLTLADGVEVDRFYHTILSSDTELQRLCRELGLADRLYFNETKMSFFHAGKIYSMNSALEFLRFPPLGWIDRLRLGLTILFAQFIRNWQKLEGVSIESWLVRLGGRRVFNNIWRPLLKAKFDGGFDNVPATWIWSRLVRMKSTRKGANQKEKAGHLLGGYITLLNAMVEKIEASGGKVHLNSPVQEIIIENNRATGLVTEGKIQPFDAIAVTAQTPVFRQLIPTANPAYLEFLDKTEYLGIVCPLLVLDRPLSGYWTVNLTNDDTPFTGIIETTTYIEPQFVGGHHLIYLPKYTAPGSPWQKISDAEIKGVWLENLEKMFPDFNRNWIREFVVSRAKYVEPLHPLNSMHLIPAINTPVDGLFLATTAQIYPALTNGESAARHAREAAGITLQQDQQPARRQPAAVTSP